MSRTTIRCVSLDGDQTQLHLIEEDGRSTAVIWPGMGALWRSVHKLELGPEGRTVTMEHPSDAVYYVAEGSVDMVLAGDETLRIESGHMVHIVRGTKYSFVSNGAQAEVLGGPCPPDPALYEHLEYVTPQAPQVNRPDYPGPDLSKPVQVFDVDEPGARLDLLASDARAVVWPGAGVYEATMFFANIQPGEQNIPHDHAYSEDTLVIMKGSATIEDMEADEFVVAKAREVVIIPPGLKHRLMADRGEVVEVIGAPAPADIDMLRKAGAEF